MKTRELTADEVRVPLSANDISGIPRNGNPALPADKFALKALDTALNIRGAGKNLFVCGPSGPERRAIVTAAAERLEPGENPCILICENRDNPNIPFLRKSAGPEDGCRVLRRPAESFPLVVENNPVPDRLFGLTSAEISSIAAGSLIESAGGILLLNADDLLEEPLSWKLLKRVLRTGGTAPGMHLTDPGISGSHEPRHPLLRPSEIRLDLKVAILGDEAQFDHLYNSDEDFGELFQFFIEFDSVIELTGESLSDAVNLFRNYTEQKLNRLLSDEAALEAVKYSIASAENKTKLSTITTEIEQILDEAAEEVTAGTEKAEITAAHIRAAVRNQSDRYSLLERRIIEDIKSGEINLRVDGLETGKVNGLAVIDKGPWSFGIPGLISARTAPGESGLVNIEHEAGLSGEIHDKWVLILEGFLRSRFAQDFPISIFASICFEQSYSEIDGDSASSSELYALLSSIAGVPLRQDIAVTGSLSQTGEIQAVGGLREKIEGFYKTCRAVNFTGRQGVIVPDKNIKNIILPDEIIDDIRNGSFHIYPVANVSDSMEILTGMEAGERNSRGQFPHGSLNNLIEKNLKKLATQAKNFGS